MSTVNPKFAQMRTDYASFQQQAKTDGLNLQNVRQQALSGLPQNATPQQKQAAVQAAVQQAVQNANDPTLSQDYNQVQQDRTQMQGVKKGHHHHGGHKAGGANTQDQSAQSVIDEGTGASVSDIQSALNGMSSDDPNYASLETMLQTALSQQQQPDVTSSSLNMFA